MTIDKHGLKIIKDFEGFRTHPYLCEAGVPTIGYGTTHYGSGRAVRTDDPSITKSVAEMLLRDEVQRIYGHAVDTFVKVPLNQNEYDALVSFVYNVGVKAFKTSTLLRDLNVGHKRDAAAEFGKWIHDNGKVSEGLVNRRRREEDLFTA